VKIRRPEPGLLKWYVLTGIAVILFFGAPALRTGVSSLLVDWTGETVLKNQVVAVISSLGSRPVQTADMEVIDYAGVIPYGANTSFQQEVDEWKLRRSMEMLRDAGIRWVRQQMPWSDIEIPAKGQYKDGYGHNTWEKYDRFIDLCQEYGLNILARLDDPPNWSRKDNTVHNRPPDNLADYGDFVYAFVSRYKGKIKYYQIWNEPNAYPEWGNQPVDARAYTELLKVAYRRAKEADPEAVIVAAGLAPTLGAPEGRAESDLVFLQKMYDAGAKDYFDVMSVMGYGLWTGPGDRRLSEDRTNFSRPQLIREIMVRNGDANKAVWMSEVGWNALPKYFPEQPAYGRVTDDQQATYTVKAYERAQNEWPWMGVMFFWKFRPVFDEDRDQQDFYFRMVDPDFTTHPVYDAYRRMATAPPVVYRGNHAADHWALSYAGSWQEERDASNRDIYQISRHAGDRLSFTFEGSELTLRARQADNGGILYVAIDGSSRDANALPEDAQGRAYVDLRNAGEADWVSIPVAKALGNGRHHVEMWTGDAGDVALSGVIVDHSSAYLSRLALVLILGAGLLVTAAVMIRSGITSRPWWKPPR